MQKIAGFKTEDGALFDNANSAHDHEIRAFVITLSVSSGNDGKTAGFLSDFIVSNKDKLLNILEKPKL